MVFEEVELYSIFLSLKCKNINTNNHILCACQSINVAVGGTNGYFPEGVGNKPWGNQSPIAMKEFWDKRNEWYPTWPMDDRRDLIIDYIKVYSA